jgi:alanyl-tRNA synthetase
MGTERLYYNDPRLLEFDADVVETRPAGSRYGVLLNRTAFYPTSGGQPHDTGTLNGVPVVDCLDDEISGNIIHVIADPLEAKHVHGVVDSVRRLDHTQQHSGQHVLSQAFVELFGWPTVSFHLGAETCTIDLAIDSVRREQADQAEDRANRIIQDNLSVSIRYFDDRTVAQAGLRKPSDKAGEIRVIDIAGYDKSACGGTHVRTTGEIGSVLVTRLERSKKLTRVEFLCGNRVLQFARRSHRALDAISQIVSVPALEAATGVRSVWDKLEAARQRIEDLELKLIDHEAASFPLEGGRGFAIFRERGIESLKSLALRICSRPATAVVFVDESDPLRVVAAASADSNVDAAVVLRKLIEKFGGRGGGRSSLAQGGGLTGNARDVLDFAKSLILPSA